MKRDDLRRPLKKLLNVVEQHRLVFLYVAEAVRENPLVNSDRTGVTQTILKRDIPGWNQVEEDRDNESFLKDNQSVIEQFAQKAISEFGSGSGCKPTVQRSDGKVVEVEGSSLPYWEIDQHDCKLLENSSDIIINTCAAVSSSDTNDILRSLIEEIIYISYDNGQQGWFYWLYIQWEYLTELDKTIALIKNVLNVVAPADPISEIINDLIAQTKNSNPHIVAVDNIAVGFIKRDSGWHWIVNGVDRGRISKRDDSIICKISKILYDQIEFGWTPHKTFYQNTGWTKDEYFGVHNQPGRMQKQLTILRKMLGVEISFNKELGVRFPENVVKSN